MKEETLSSLGKFHYMIVLKVFVINFFGNYYSISLITKRTSFHILFVRSVLNIGIQYRVFFFLFIYSLCFYNIDLSYSCNNAHCFYLFPIQHEYAHLFCLFPVQHMVIKMNFQIYLHLMTSCRCFVYGAWQAVAWYSVPVSGYKESHEST